MRDYDIVSAEFLAEMVKPENKGLCELFIEMLESRIMRSATDCAKIPSGEISQWAGGQISICDEYINGIRSASADLSAKANGAILAGLQSSV